MSGRAQRLAELLPEAGVDLVLISDLVNVRYLTGYCGTNGLALVGPEIRTFITDFRYVQQAAEQVESSFERREAPQELLEAIGEALPRGRLKLGFESTHVSVRSFERLGELLGAEVELVPVENVVEKLRAVKDPHEVSAIKAAAKLADEAFERLLSSPLKGRTEREISIELELEMLKLGAERPSFETIVAAGAHGALPHASPRDVQLDRGDMVVIDWGAQLAGYCSDCTRTVAIEEPPGRAKELYDLVLEAQLQGLAAVQSGAQARGVDASAREVIEAAGHGQHFGHGLGHGVGLDVHEAPRLSRRSEDTLQSGNVVTVEPGVYLPGELGIRIEDLVVVGEDGSDVLSSVSKELLVVG